jgi:hypothetical protein
MSQKYLVYNTEPIPSKAHIVWRVHYLQDSQRILTLFI